MQNQNSNNPTPIGQTYPTEWTTTTDPESGRTLRRLTSGNHNNYPLYYFIQSVTPEKDYMVFHSERSGWVQLCKLDLASGEIMQLSAGTTRDAGWAIWCEPRLRGIYNHLSALNEARREVYYFQDDDVLCTHIDSLENRVVHSMPGRISIGQTGFSPDGKHFAFIHADRALFEQAIADRESTINMGRRFSHEEWREGVPCTIGVINTETGVYHDVVNLDYHVHHVFFIANDRLLINHTRGRNGMWTVMMDGSDVRTLRGRTERGDICHQIITERGIYFEANVHHTDNGSREVWYGLYDLATDTWDEVQLPGLGYVHTGNDPAGKFLFVENQDGSKGHQLLSIHHPHDPEKYRLNTLRTLTPIIRGQRFHAHPFLGPDRQWLYFTEVVDGFSHVSALDVSDLVDLDEYW
ncbi:MAG: hypothetical protein AAF639_22430 [Chloroflexota bacterium]